MPAYDAANANHREISALAKELAIIAEGHCATDPYLADPAKALAARRRKLRALLEESPPLQQLESFAATVLKNAPVASPYSDGDRG